MHSTHLAILKQLKAVDMPGNHNWGVTAMLIEPQEIASFP